MSINFDYKVGYFGISKPSLMATNININTIDYIMEINANTRITYKGREGKRSDTEDSR